jgi:uncharacterized protein
VTQQHDRPWAACADGLVVTVRLTPCGGRDLIGGIERVRAAATEGEANDALTRLLARTAGVAPSAVRLIGGATSRIKRLHIGGDPRALAVALARVMEAAS